MEKSKNEIIKVIKETQCLKIVTLFLTYSGPMLNQ